ncbi:hypothetical protein [Ectopseudomonas oleovorans]|uniref:hypothetical protein n=1 Tax=Ectopseudomonas oleovorans TaxID=301 RepID=UPI0035B27E89
MEWLHVCKMHRMAIEDLQQHSVAQLLAQHSVILGELRRRGVCRSANNPTGDYAEWLVKERLALTLAGPSAKSFDATDASGLRYQIKARRRDPGSRGNHLSAIRDLDARGFDVLVAVMFDSDWSVKFAVKMPHERVVALATFKDHVNGHVLQLRPSLLHTAGVEDISGLLSP